MIKTNKIGNVAGTVEYDVDGMGIESGSNADTTWTKFPDGTLIVCGIINTSGDITVPWGTLFEGADGFGKDFPPEVVFTSRPSVTYGGRGIGGVGGSFWVSINDTPTVTRTGRIFLVRPTVDVISGDRRVQYQAIGRWK